MFKKFVFLGIVILIALPLVMMVGCGGRGSSNSLALVPQKANMVGEVSLGEILSDDDFADIFDRLPKKYEDPQTFNDALDAFEGETGIDLRQFDSGVFFGDVSQSESESGYFGVIVVGDFNKSDLVSALEEYMGENLGTVDYKGYEIYTGANDQAALCFLSDRTLVIGGMVPVKDVIQVKEGDRPPLSGDLLETYNGLGDALIKVASVVPSDQTQQRLLGNFSESQINLSAFSDVQRTGIALIKEAQAISFKADLYFTDSQSAEDSEKMLTFVGLFVEMLPIPEQGQALLPGLLEKLQVVRQDKLLTITIEMTASEIEDIIESGKTS